MFFILNFFLISFTYFLSIREKTHTHTQVFRMCSKRGKLPRYSTFLQPLILSFSLTVSVALLLRWPPTSDEFSDWVLSVVWGSAGCSGFWRFFQRGGWVFLGVSAEVHGGFCCRRLVMTIHRSCRTKIENKTFSCCFDRNYKGRVIRIQEENRRKKYALSVEEIVIVWISDSIDDLLHAPASQKFFRKVDCNNGFTWIQKISNKREASWNSRKLALLGENST